MGWNDLVRSSREIETYVEQGIRNIQGNCGKGYSSGGKWGGINSANSYESGSGQYSSTMSTNPSQGFVENGSFDSGYIAGSNGYDAFPPANPTSSVRFPE